MGTKMTRAEAANALAKIKACCAAGLTIPETAETLGLKRHQVASLSWRHGVSGWKQGAAARNQFGVNNPNFKGGDSRATVSRATKKILSLGAVNLFVCNRCGTESSVEFPRHHIDRDRTNNSFENLEVLCHSCHNKEHMNERTRNNQGQFSG